jgi:hypothetical protein
MSLTKVFFTCIFTAGSIVFISSASAFTETIPASTKPQNRVFIHKLKMFLAAGTQLTSKTLYNQDGIRIDVENPNPDKRPGQVHLQTGNEKYIYDPSTGAFKGAPSKIQKLLDNSAIAAAVRKGVEQYLGIIPWKP